LFIISLCEPGIMLFMPLAAESIFPIFIVSVPAVSLSVILCRSIFFIIKRWSCLEFFKLHSSVLLRRLSRNYYGMGGAERHTPLA